MTISGEATVVKNAGSHFMLSPLPVWSPFPAVLKGKVRLKGGDSTNPVAVGDHVKYSAIVQEGDDILSITLENPATISEILPRTNHVKRKSSNLSRQSLVIAAIMDLANIIVCLFFPEI